MSITFDPEQHPHRRFNPLTGEWVLVAPHRLKRPWRGQVEKRPVEERPAYDPTCYLCPGNERAGGVHNPDYTGTYVFENDFPSVFPDNPKPDGSEHPLLRIAGEQGLTRVVCFSPRHDLTLAEMEVEGIRRVVDTWAAQVEELGAAYRWVQIWENKGAMMGASNPHPHGQLWGQETMPNEAVKEDRNQRDYYEARGTPLLLDYVRLEVERGERLVAMNEQWVALVPYWALWPFETIVLPRRHVRHLPELRSDERDALAATLKEVLVRYDNLFEVAFPYSMGWHGSPAAERYAEHWQLHAHFYPPLLRSATVRKFMVGYEMLGEGQRDLTAEEAARRLRALPAVH